MQGLGGKNAMVRHACYDFERLNTKSLTEDDPCTVTTSFFKFPTHQKRCGKAERQVTEQVVVF